MKTRILAALALLESAAFDVRPGGRGEIDFKQALVELQAAVDMPEPEAKTIEVKEVATDVLAAAVAAKLGEQLAGSGEAVQGHLNDLFGNVATRLANVEAATASILTVTQASSDKLDGMEDTLGAFVASHTDATPA